jgi:hypothetical protein
MSLLTQRPFAPSRAGAIAASGFQRKYDSMYSTGRAISSGASEWIRFWYVALCYVKDNCLWHFLSPVATSLKFFHHIRGRRIVSFRRLRGWPYHTLCGIPTFSNSDLFSMHSLLRRLIHGCLNHSDYWIHNINYVLDGWYTSSSCSHHVFRITNLKDFPTPLRSRSTRISIAIPLFYWPPAHVNQPLSLSSMPLTLIFKPNRR